MKIFPQKGIADFEAVQDSWSKSTPIFSSTQYGRFLHKSEVFFNQWFLVAKYIFLAIPSM